VLPARLVPLTIGLIASSVRIVAHDADRRFGPYGAF